MKYALGLFHFNPYWGADAISAHRHCTESLGPFLRALDAMPSWRVDVEMAGCGLEFLRGNYPNQLQLLRTLVERGQVELVSSLYTPNIWVAFPRRDLEMSIELNKRCLRNLGFPWTRLFFAQEAFFGAGVEFLTEHFDAAICKDDYLFYYYKTDLMYPHFRLGGMRVTVASGHVLREVTSQCSTNPEFARVHRLTHTHVEYIRNSIALNQEANFPACQVVLGSLGYYWYHCGDGNHFGCTAKPDNPEEAYFDSIWSAVVIASVKSVAENGYKLCTVGEFLKDTEDIEPRNLPPLVEGSWNPTNSHGVFRWMGWNSTPAENDAGVMTVISRARRRLIQAETTCEAENRERSCDEKIGQAWQSLLHAQISDTLGWFANSRAVGYAMNMANQVLMLATQVIEHCGGDLDSSPCVMLPSNLDSQGLVF